MDLLQRIQRWYTINCDGDWEHSFGMTITNLDNPGWAVSIDLNETCLQNAVLDNCLVERTTTDWVGFSVERTKFEGRGGPNNLSEILAYFLDTFLPPNIDSEFTYELHLPMRSYEGQLWLKAEARVVSESTLEIVSIANHKSPNSYEWNLDAEVELLNEIEAALPDLKTDFIIGDLVEPIVYQAPSNQLRTFLVATPIDIESSRC